MHLGQRRLTEVGRWGGRDSGDDQCGEVLSWVAMARRRQLERCPECDTEFPRGRLACPECGSDARTGWKSEEEIQYQSVQIPDTYEEMVGDAGPKRSIRSIVYLVAALLALVAMLLWVFSR